MLHAAGRLFGGILFVCLITGAHAQQGGAVPALVYDAQTRGPAPIPPSERGLQTVVAEPWFKASDEGLVLEGPASTATATCSSATCPAGACSA